MRSDPDDQSGRHLVSNKWNLIKRHTGRKAREGRPVSFHSAHTFSADMRARIELLEEWIWPSSNPNLGGDQYEALAFDGAGNLLGKIGVRDEYDIDLLDEEAFRASVLVADDRGHRKVDQSYLDILKTVRELTAGGTPAS